MEKENAREFESKLILEVKNNSCLYTKDDPAYSNKSNRSDAWSDIASILGKTTDECQKKWTTLRNSFRSYFHTENNTPSGSVATAPVKWIHFQSLKFLIPYVKVPGDGDDCGNFSEVNSSFNDRSNEYSQPSLPFEIEVDVGTEEIVMPITQSAELNRPNRKSKKRKNDEPLDRVLNAIENSGRRSPMELFMENMALQVQHFNQRRAIRFQRRILEVLAEEMENVE